MKLKSTILLSVMLTTLILVAGASELWAVTNSAVPDPNLIVPGVNPNASGTKISGPLTIWYEVTNNNDPTCLSTFGNGTKTQMHFFMRLRKGSRLFAFGGVGANLCYVDFSGQAAAINAYISSSVIPFVATTGASYALKNVDQLVQDSAGTNVPGDGTPGNPFFVIMDITLGVVE